MATTKQPAVTRLALLLATVWSLAFAGLFAWNLSQNQRVTEELAANEARAHFSKDRAFRLWATSHNLIYAPVSERNPPDPYLDHLPEREVTTPSGVLLTVINPARMVRQMDEEYGQGYRVRTRITSLQPLRPENAPDPWERRVLEQFAQGVPEAFETIDQDGTPVLRLMRPLDIEPGCLNCHAYQGLSQGDVAGAVGVSLPMDNLLARQHGQAERQAVTYGLVWLIGLVGQWAGYRKLRRYEGDQLRMLATLEQSENRKAAILCSAIDCIVSMDARGRITEFNPAAERTFGRQREEVIGLLLSDVMIPEDLRARHQAGMQRLLETGVERILNRRIKTRGVRDDGSEFPLELTVTRVSSGDDEFFTAYLRDITEEQRLSEQLSHQATHDALTGLINRQEFEQRLHTLIEKIAEHDQHALFYLDLDQFKVINDTNGHAAGDEMLRQVAGVLQHRVRSSDTLARLGGDEFGVLLVNCPMDRAIAVAGEILDQVRGFRFDWNGQTYTAGVSIGVVMLNHREISPVDALSDADTACYQAKEEGRNRMHLFRHDDTEVARRRGEMHWVTRINDTIEQDRLVLFRQFIYPVSADTGLNHFEILLRMRDEQGACTSAQACLSAAERYNLSTAIDRWVVSATLDWLDADKAERERLGLCSINLSGHSVGDQAFLDFLLQRIARSAVPTQKLCFEITETAAVTRLDRATRFMETLRECGCQFALDDFGSGMSSFGYLQHLPVDWIKIDGQFVRDMAENPVNHAMVRSINDIGHVLGKRTIAEFVENDAILAQLRELGVDYAQGYGLGKPGPVRLADRMRATG